MVFEIKTYASSYDMLCDLDGLPLMRVHILAYIVYLVCNLYIFIRLFDQSPFTYRSFILESITHSESILNENFSIEFLLISGCLFILGDLELVCLEIRDLE